VIELCSRPDGIAETGTARGQSFRDGLADVGWIAGRLCDESVNGHLKVP
jgi:hypothetical protein